MKKTVSCILAVCLTLLFSASFVYAAEPEIRTDTTTAETALFGSPWVDSIVTGNLPEEVPEAKDDLYLHYNYDAIAEHQGQYYVPIQENMNAVKDYLSQFMNSGSLTGAADGSYTDAELEQLSIFYQQASDLEALSKAGISELQPYLDRINNVKSLSELNDVLASEDFPFSPFLYFLVSTCDLSGVNTVAVYPEFLFVDNLDGAISFQDSDDPAISTALQQSLSSTLVSVLGDLGILGFSQEEATVKVRELFDFEKGYGKDAYYGYRYQDMDYGAMGACIDNLSLEELAALCPNYPVKETITKFGKGDSPAYIVYEKNWLDTFNSVWTEENLEMLKTLTMVKVVHECAPYLDPAFYDSARAMMGKPALDASGNAVEACDKNATFAQLVAKIYVADHYSQEDITRLNSTTNDLLAAFMKLIEQSSWLNEGSRAEMIQKLDEMRLCILAPDGGYLDFSDLSLTKTEDGGTLFGNYLKLKSWINEKINARIGQPSLARLAFEHFAPDTVNCFYDQPTNSINILPGFTAAGMYRSDMSEEELMGTIGWVIGHEVGHGFDYLGSQFDAYGKGNSIYDEDSLKVYLEKVGKLVAYIDSIEVLPGVFGAGNLWKTEAGADIIGLELVMTMVKEKSDFDYEEFFKNAAYTYLQVLPSPDTLYIYLTIDGHPLNYLRTNVNAQMVDELYETYDIQDGDGMYLPEEQRIHFYR